MDLADAHLAALEFLENHKPQIVSMNIGTGNGSSVMEIVDSFMEINDILVPYEFANRRKGDPACVVADNSLAFKFIEMVTKKSIPDMCSDTWKWINSQN